MNHYEPSFLFFKLRRRPRGTDHILRARMLWIDQDAPLDHFSGQSAAAKWEQPGLDRPRDWWTKRRCLFHDAAQVTWNSIKEQRLSGPSVHWNTAFHKLIVIIRRIGQEATTILPAST